MRNLFVTFFRAAMAYITAILYLSGSLFPAQVLAGDYAENVTAQQFFKEMEKRHHFDDSELRKLFSRVYRDQRILDLMSKPAEKRLAWREYRKIFLDNVRIRNGIKFWEENERVISDASDRYGVPGEIIVAIIGVETRYGKVTGNHRVISALSTLAFDYPPRSRFFRNELESFLLLTREENKSPLELKGSYAGAMGYGQFMPSSYRAYAVDSDGDGKRDIWNSRADAIGSVANYLSAHNWEKGAGVATRVQLDSDSRELPENLFSDMLNYQNPYLHTNFKITSGGETIFLSDVSGNVIDTMHVPEMDQDISYGYYNDGGGALSLFDDPTPGESNSDSEAFYGYTSDPEFSNPGGFKDEFFNLFITSETEDATIYYTTDGSKPDQSSNIYNNFLAINNSLLISGTQTQDDYGLEFSPTHNGIIIRAVAIAPGHVPSKTITHSYIFDPLNTTLPVISIAIDPDDMFDPITGMYVRGNSFWPFYPFYGSNFWNDWEKEVHIELYEPGGELGFSQDAGMKIFGGWSRAEAQKSFSFFARSIYGKGNFDYKLFPDSEVDSYESFILRAHGQDNVMFRDGFHTTLASENGVPVQDYRPAVVYLNGEFWGIQNIREKVNEHYVETHYDIDNDNLDLLSTIASTSEPELLHGSTEDYLEIRDFMNNNDISIQSNYEIASQHYDVESLIEYKIAQIFVMNYDWPGNNNKLFKAKSSEGKWQHIMFDSDFGFERWTDGAIFFIGGSYETYNMLDHAYGSGNAFNNPVWSTAIFTAFLDNEEFKHQFINTYCDRINTTYSTDHTSFLIDSLKTVVAPYVANHIFRYGSNPDDSYTPNTLTAYNAAVQRMYNFASYRPDNARNEMVELFDLNGVTNTVSLFVNDSEAGHIKINTLNVNEQGWSGEYFSDIPISIKAVPEFGYEFSHWANQPTFTDSINLLLDQNMTMIAHFSEMQNPYQNMVVINEINYHSSDDFDSGDWVELHNQSNLDIDISQWEFMDSDDSHIFTINDGIVLGSGEYLVLCRDSSDFSQIYPNVQNFIGEIDFGFSNGGELLRLLDDTEGLVDFVSYDDSAPWPVEADGGGVTLELLNPTLDNNSFESWAVSSVELGTPGQQNSSFDALSNDANRLLPSVFALHQNYPNPFNPSTNINYDLPQESHVTVTIFDIIGKHVKTLVQDNQSAGFKTIRWDGKNQKDENVAAGMYVYQIKSGLNVLSKKMILLR